jgi:hypothetical protein
MKTVELFRDFDYRPHPRWSVRFLAGITYRRVLEAAATAIERAGAGRVVPAEHECGVTGQIQDARHAFNRRR